MDLSPILSLNCLVSLRALIWVLACLLFSSMIFQKVPVAFLLFADDINIYAGSSHHLTRRICRGHFDHHWCVQWLDLYISKCQVVLFEHVLLYLLTLTTIHWKYRVDQMIDLNVVLTSSLSPADHITCVTSKAYVQTSAMSNSPIKP